MGISGKGGQGKLFRTLWKEEAILGHKGPPGVFEPGPFTNLVGWAPQGATGQG